MGLAELEVLHVVLFDKGLPRHVKRSEQPTTARAFLVGNRLPLSLNFTVVDVDVGLKTPDQDLQHSLSMKELDSPSCKAGLQRIRSSADVLSQAVLVGGVEILFEPVQDLGSQLSSSHDDMVGISKINRDVLQFVEMRIGSETIFQ